MALRLGKTPELIDPHDGLSSIGRKRVAVLHERSFQDDATRMLRAVRYAARLGFKLDPPTESWLRRDLGYLDAISGPRLRRELHLIFEEPSAVAAARMATRLGLLGGVHEALTLPDRRCEALARRLRRTKRWRRETRPASASLPVTLTTPP